MLTSKAHRRYSEIERSRCREWTCTNPKCLPALPILRAQLPIVRRSFHTEVLIHVIYSLSFLCAFWAWQMSFLRMHYTGQQKNTFFKTYSKFILILERNGVLNTMLPSVFLKIKQFSRGYMLEFQKMQIFRGHTFILTAQKKFCSSKRFLNFNIFWSGIVCLTRCCLQLFPRPHNFPVVLC